MKLLIIVIFLMPILATAYVRLAPHDVEIAHTQLSLSEPEARPGPVKQLIKGDLMDLHKIIISEPRTILLAGSPKKGHATYVTRSLIWGFPDYTTVQRENDELLIFARQRFGQNDLGVNAARVDRWIDALAAN